MDLIFCQLKKLKKTDLISCKFKKLKNNVFIFTAGLTAPYREFPMGNFKNPYREFFRKKNKLKSLQGFPIGNYYFPIGNSLQGLQFDYFLKLKSLQGFLKFPIGNPYRDFSFFFFFEQNPYRESLQGAVRPAVKKKTLFGAINQTNGSQVSLGP